MHFQPIEHSADDAYLSQAGQVSDVDTMPAELPAGQDPFDDVFGSEPGTPTELRDFPSSSHPSDMRRLQTEHTTAGYREGVAVAKEKSVQAGFDEGFTLGATVGLSAGQLLGMLEGIAEAVKSQPDEESTKTAQNLLMEAREDLGTEKIFSPEYWAPDGNWSYQVKSQAGDDVLFSDVARDHPLIVKWTSIVDNQIDFWKINPSILEDENVPRLETAPSDPLATSTAPSASKALDW